MGNLLEHTDQQKKPQSSIEFAPTIPRCVEISSKTRFATITHRGGIKKEYLSCLPSQRNRWRKSSLFKWENPTVFCNGRKNLRNARVGDVVRCRIWKNIVKYRMLIAIALGCSLTLISGCSQGPTKTDKQKWETHELPDVMCDASGCRGVGDTQNQWKSPNEQSTPNPRQS